MLDLLLNKLRKALSEPRTVVDECIEIQNGRARFDLARYLTTEEGAKRLDAMASTVETKTEQCETCKKPLPPLAQWSMPSCPACVQKAETAPCEHSWVISNFEAPRCLWCLVEKSAVNTSPALLTESCNGAHEWVPFSNKDADVKIELCGKCGLEKHTTKATIRAVR
jgi:hypothetical protein